MLSGSCGSESVLGGVHVAAQFKANVADFGISKVDFSTVNDLISRVQNREVEAGKSDDSVGGQKCTASFCVSCCAARWSGLVEKLQRNVSHYMLVLTLPSGILAGCILSDVLTKIVRELYRLLNRINDDIERSNASAHTRHAAFCNGGHKLVVIDGGKDAFQFRKLLHDRRLFFAGGGIVILLHRGFRGSIGFDIGLGCFVHTNFRESQLHRDG